MEHVKHIHSKSNMGNTHNIQNNSLFSKLKKLFKKNPHKKNTEFGRAMVEILGVLAIVGVLSAGSLYIYRNAFYTSKENQTLDIINKTTAGALTGFLHKDIGNTLVNKLDRIAASQVNSGVPVDTAGDIITPIQTKISVWTAEGPMSLATPNAQKETTGRFIEIHLQNLTYNVCKRLLSGKNEYKAAYLQTKRYSGINQEATEEEIDSFCSGAVDIFKRGPSNQEPELNTEANMILCYANSPSDCGFATKTNNSCVSSFGSYSHNQVVRDCGICQNGVITEDETTSIPECQKCSIYTNFSNQDIEGCVLTATKVETGTKIALTSAADGKALVVESSRTASGMPSTANGKTQMLATVLPTSSAKKLFTPMATTMSKNSNNEQSNDDNSEGNEGCENNSDCPEGSSCFKCKSNAECNGVFSFCFYGNCIDDCGIFAEFSEIGRKCLCEQDGGEWDSENLVCCAPYTKYIDGKCICTSEECCKTNAPDTFYCPDAGCCSNGTACGIDPITTKGICICTSDECCETIESDTFYCPDAGCCPNGASCMINPTTGKNFCFIPCDIVGGSCECEFRKRDWCGVTYNNGVEDGVCCLKGSICADPKNKACADCSKYSSKEECICKETGKTWCNGTCCKSYELCTNNQCEASCLLYGLMGYSSEAECQCVKEKNGKWCGDECCTQEDIKYDNICQDGKCVPDCRSYASQEECKCKRNLRSWCNGECCPYGKDCFNDKKCIKNCDDLTGKDKCDCLDTYSHDEDPLADIFEPKYEWCDNVCCSNLDGKHCVNGECQCEKPENQCGNECCNALQICDNGECKDCLNGQLPVDGHCCSEGETWFD